MEIERRQYERQKLYSPEYFDMGAENGGMIVDISEDGLGFQAVSRVEKDSEIAVSFSLGGGYRISARARIAWVGANGNSGGTTFTLLPADSRSIIREWVTKTAEAAMANDAAAAVEAEITASESKTEEPPLIIERVESPRAPFSVPPVLVELAPETHVAPETVVMAESLVEPVEAIAQATSQPEIPAAEPFAAPPDAPTEVIAQDIHPHVATDAEPEAPPVSPQVSEPAIPENIQQDAGTLVQQNVRNDSQPGVDETVSSMIPPKLQAEPDAASASGEGRDETAVSPAPSIRANASAPDASPADSLSLATPVSPTILPEIPAAIPPNISARATEKNAEPEQAPAVPPHAEPPRPLFPPRNAGGLFSRSPWISEQSVPEEERSHKRLIAVIVIFVIIAAALASVPYIRSHRQQIGASIENMGRSVAGQSAPNVTAPSQQLSQQPSHQLSKQPSQTTQPSAQNAAPPSTTAGAATRVSPSSSSATTTAPAPSGSQMPSQQKQSAASSANSGAASSAQNPAAARPPALTPPAPNSTAVFPSGGQFEFQQARKYLNGTGAIPADPSEAAEWFWRSLEKGNTAAAIPLADLYLQGKGVSRSCLQARILLTAASHKGNAEAIQKLSQLPENCEQ